MWLFYVWCEDFLCCYEVWLFVNLLFIYQEFERLLDLQLIYDVIDELILMFDVINIIEEIFFEYYQYEDIYNFYNGLYSCIFVLGVCFKMQKLIN